MLKRTTAQPTSSGMPGMPVVDCYTSGETPTVLNVCAVCVVSCVVSMVAASRSRAA